MEGRRARSWLAPAAVAAAALALCARWPSSPSWVPPGTDAGARPAAVQPQDAVEASGGLAPALAAAAARPAAPLAAPLAAAGAALAAALALGRRRRQPARGLPQRKARGGEAVENTDQESALDLDGSIWDVLMNTDSYIEEDRQFRRPVFGYADWRRHRSAQRFMRNLSSLPVSTTIRANWKEVLSVTTVAAALCLWNDAEAAAAALSLGPDAVAFAKSLPELSLPGLPFTVSSASLSLLLVFRTNKAYERWWEARCIWGAIINTCRDIVRQSLVRMDPQDMALKAEVTRLVSAFPRSLIYHVGERTDISNRVLEKKYRKILTDEETDKLLKCTHKPMTVTGMLADAVHRAKLPVIDEMKIDQDITKFSDYYGMCERIFKTPIPLSYTRLTSRFLSIWLLALPLALYAAITPHWLIIPITAMIAFFIFGIEEIAFQIEEPFSALAMNAMADGIDASIFEALELEKKDPFTFKPRDGWKRADAQPQKFAAFFSKPAAPPREAGVAIEAEPELAAASTVVKNVEGRFRFAASAAPAQDGDASEAPVQPSDAPEDSLVYPTNHALTVPKRTPDAGKRSWPRRLVAKVKALLGPSGA